MQLPAQRPYLAKAERVQPLSQLFRRTLAPHEERAGPNNAMLSAGFIDFSSAAVDAPRCAKLPTSVFAFRGEAEALARGQFTVQRAEQGLRRDPDAVGCAK